MEANKTNHLAVIAVVIGHHVFGFLWYGVIFSASYLSLLGIAPENANPSPFAYVVYLIANLTVCYTLVWLFKRLKVSSAIEGVKVALACWLGFYTFITFTQAMFIQQPAGLMLIHAGHTLVNYSLAGVVLGGWQKR